MRALTRFLQNLATILLATALTLVLAEGVFRYLDKSAWYETLEPNTPAPVAYTKNSLGTRGPELAPVSQNTYRVLFLGDSFTYGDGMPNEQELFVAKLEKSANSRGEGKRFEFVNAGISGSLTDDWLKEYDRLVGVVKPSLVIAVFFLRDGSNLRFASQFYRLIYSDIVESNNQSELYQRSALYRYFRRKWDAKLIAARYEQKFLDSYFGNDEQKKEWVNAQKNLLSLRERSLKNNSKFALVVFPVLSDLDGDYKFRNIVDEVMGFAKTNSIPAHSLLPAFLGQDPANLWVSPSDQHPNEKGHAIAAESIYPFLMELQRP